MRYCLNTGYWLLKNDELDTNFCIMKIADKKYWIFDLDGTLTIAIHDFKAIKKEIGLSSDTPILETLETFTDKEAHKIYKRLENVELALARKAKPQENVLQFLKTLQNKNCTLGILTRNSVSNACETLRCCGLLECFKKDFILGRDSCKPKPDPDGVIQLLKKWHASPKETVIIGDYVFDLMAGKKAGIAAIFYDAKGQGEWNDHADYTVHSFKELINEVS